MPALDETKRVSALGIVSEHPCLADEGTDLPRGKTKLSCEFVRDCVPIEDAAA
jgi:hypothetical protein